MTFRREVREKLDRIGKLLEDENRHALTIVSLERRIAMLERHNRELFDRLMARDFQEFAVYAPPTEPGTDIGMTAIPEDADEDNAGEVLEIGDEA